jgi:hypothetical protein
MSTKSRENLRKIESTPNPAPWEYEAHQTDENTTKYKFFVTNGMPSDVIECYRESNAKLIRAAPGLLGACEGVLEVLRNRPDNTLQYRLMVLTLEGAIAAAKDKP